MTKLRKFFASSVMVMTVVVMSGLTAPMTTNAAASAGDLIKKDGLSAVYYLGEDGKRYVFPNEATYKSWYSDFSGVVTISADELASYPLGGNVVVRPGTKLVKITTDPRVYAVEANGTLRQVASEADAIALFGTAWAKRVIDVADSFFTNYTIGSPLTSNEVPAGSLVKKTGDSNIYYFDGTNYRLIEDEVAFLANRFQYANVLTVSTFTAGGSTITGAEAGIIKTSQGGSTGTVNPDQGTGVTVSLNSMTPASQSVPSTVGRVPFAKVNLTASADGAAYVESITVTRTGLTTLGTTFKVWAEKNGVSVTSKRALSSDKAILTFSPALNIAAGQTVAIDVLAEVAGVTGNGALGIASASDISASGSTVSGSFPMNGNLMSFTTYNVTGVDFDVTSTTYAPKVGDEATELGKFNIELTSNDRDVVLNTLTLRNTGVEDLSTSLMNVYLESNGEVVSNNATFNGRYMTFAFKNGGMDLLKDDGDADFIIKGDVIGSESTGTIILSLNKQEDLYAYEKATGFGVSYEASIMTQATFGTITIDSGVVDISKKSTSPASQDVIKGTKTIVALIANVRADEAITADSFKIKYNGEETSFQNAKVYVNNALLGSFDLATGAVYGSSAAASTTEEIDSTVSLNKGNNEIKVTVDVKTTATANHKFKATLENDFLTAGSPEYVSNGNPVSAGDINGTATGADITVSGGGMTFVNNDGYAADKKIVQGAINVSLGKFALKATDDAIKLTSIVIGENIGNSTGINTSTPASSIYDMKIFIDGVQVGSTKDFTTAGATFSSLNYSIAKDTTKNIELFGSFDSSAADVASTTFKATTTVNAQDSLGKVIDAQSAVTKQFRVTIGGTLSVAKAADTVGANILIAKATEQEVAKFKFTAVDDSANITEFSVINTSTTPVGDARISSYKLYLGSTLLDEATPFNGTTTFNIANNRLLVAANGSQTVTIKAVFNGIEVNTDSGLKLKLQIEEESIVAKASSGTELAQSAITDSAVVSNEMIVRVTKPTFAKVNGFVGGASANQEVLRFTIAADANEDLKVTSLVFSEYGSAVASVSTYTLYEVTDSAAITRTGSANTFTGMDIQIAKGTSKTFKLIANTGSLLTDATFGVTLENSTVANIGWGEYFIGGYTTADGTSLSEFPIDGGIKTY